MNPSLWIRRLFCLAGVVLISTLAVVGASQRQWVVYDGQQGPGRGKSIVLVSGDEEYRSEEALPQLGKILSKHYGFKCTVLFAIDPASGRINPNVTNNIPGLEALESADLMILFTRFRDLPAEQMGWIDQYLKSGRPVLAMRTATHAFNYKEPGDWSHYGNGYKGEKQEWIDGFGRLVLGEKWVSHHGKHKQESTRALVAANAQSHPVIRGIGNGDIWSPTDVYTVRLPLPGDSQPLLMGEVVQRRGEYDESDIWYGMRASDGPAVEGKNDPMMPVAWTKSYRIPEGKTGRAVVTTMGCSVDLLSEGFRRLMVNAALWLVGMESEISPGGSKADLVGEYKPTAFGFRKGDYWPTRQMKVSEHELH